MDRAVPTLKQNDIAIFLLTSNAIEPNNWMSAVKQMGGTSLSLSFEKNNQQTLADVTIELDRGADQQYELLIAQLNLAIIFTHLSTSITLR